MSYDLFDQFHPELKAVLHNASGNLNDRLILHAFGEEAVTNGSCAAELQRLIDSHDTAIDYSSMEALDRTEMHSEDEWHQLQLRLKRMGDERRWYAPRRDRMTATEVAHRRERAREHLKGDPRYGKWVAVMPPIDSWVVDADPREAVEIERMWVWHDPEER